MATNENGHRYETCGAARKHDRGPCTRPAGWGTSHPGTGYCKLHGGSTPSGEQHGKKLAAQKAVAAFGLPREIDPDQALMEELWRCAGLVAFFERLISTGELPAEENATGRKRAVRLTQATMAGEQPSVWYAMFAQERDRMHAVAKTCKAVGIEERRVRVVEELGGQIAQVLRNVLGDLGVADDPRVPEIVRRRLTEVAGE
jgi:hypothetical protein